MNETEEKLWDYIDGNGTPGEREAISFLIASDPVYKARYNDLLKLNADFAAMELDEPPMAFTYNVMQAIRAEAEFKPLKAAVDPRIIWFIGVLFVALISAMLIYLAANVNWHQPGTTPDVLPQIKMPAVGLWFNDNLIRGFIVFDMVLGLYFLDHYLRRKLTGKQV